MSLGYVARRLGMLVLVIVLAVTINFAIPRLTPGDPVEQKLAQLVATSGGQVGDVTAMVAAYRARFGLDQPVWKQYLHYWASLARLDLGYSLENFPERVSDAIAAALPWTVGLLGASTLCAFGIGSLLGGLLGWPGSPRGVRVLVPALMLLSAVPYFLLGVVLVFVLAIHWKVFPPAGGAPFGAVLGLDWPTATALLRHAALPALSIVLAGLGAWALGMRGTMVSVLGEDYIAFAEARGLPPARIFLWYGVRNALLPQLTALALTLGHVVSGAILVEVVFAYPGVGFKLYQAILAKDYFMIQGIVWLLIVSIALTTFLLDLAYPLIDPRIRHRRA
jgi:peptide/nickel transport system permease protein